MDNLQAQQTEPATASSALPNAPAAAQLLIDDSRASADYANFCRLLNTPEELLIDFGFNLQPMTAAGQSAQITQRVATGWHTAKRLLQVLQMSVARHEAAFGVIETDVQRRIRHT